MPRTRSISPDFWTCEAIVDCSPMARLLFLGLQTFADDFGVQPPRPRTIKMQVFPGDAIDAEAIRALIEELASHGLVRLYSVAGQDYIAIADWQHAQRVGKRAMRRHPDIVEADQVLTGDAPSAETIANHSNPPSSRKVDAARDLPRHTLIGLDPPAPLAPLAMTIGPAWETSANHSNPPPEAGDRCRNTSANHSNVDRDGRTPARAAA